LRHRAGDQAQRRETGESGKPGQGQGGSEGAARDDQGFAPGLARSRPKKPIEDVFASLKPQLWQWQAAMAGPRGGLNFT
jgi:hypothetical protein